MDDTPLFFETRAERPGVVGATVEAFVVVGPDAFVVVRTTVTETRRV